MLKESHETEKKGFKIPGNKRYVWKSHETKETCSKILPKEKKCLKIPWSKWWAIRNNCVRNVSWCLVD